jgi:hypothetical protein
MPDIPVRASCHHLLSPLELHHRIEVASWLDPDNVYGIWWYNRVRAKSSQASEMGPEGRVYRRRRKNSRKDRSEWIAIPVPDAGIALEVVQTARRTVQDHKTGSKASGRFWELSGGVARCTLCGLVVRPRPVTYKLKPGGKSTSTITAARRPTAPHGG